MLRNKTLDDLVVALHVHFMEMLLNIWWSLERATSENTEEKEDIAATWVSNFCVRASNDLEKWQFPGWRSMWLTGVLDECTSSHVVCVLRCVWYLLSPPTPPSSFSLNVKFQFSAQNGMLILFDRLLPHHIKNGFLSPKPCDFYIIFVAFL